MFYVILGPNHFIVYTWCVAEMYVCVNTFFLYLLFFLSKQSRRKENRVRACTRPHSSSLFWGRIKRKPRRYKFIIVHAEPFFPLNTRGERIFLRFLPSYIYSERRNFAVTAKLSLLLSILWFNEICLNQHEIILIICWVSYKIFFVHNTLSFIITERWFLRYDTASARDSQKYRT